MSRRYLDASGGASTSAASSTSTSPTVASLADSAVYISSAIIEHPCAAVHPLLASGMSASVVNTDVWIIGGCVEREASEHTDES